MGLMQWKLAQSFQFWAFMAQTVAAVQEMREESQEGTREVRMNASYARMSALVKAGKPPPPEATEMELRFYAELASNEISERIQTETHSSMSATLSSSPSRPSSPPEPDEGF